jgi:hypothetical protein
MSNNEQTFFIDGTLPSMNDIIAACHSKYRGKYNNMKKKSAERISLAMRESNIQHVDHALFEFLWIEPNKRRDPDNVCAGGRKFILDTIVSCGIMKDDSAKYVMGFKDDWGYDKESPGVQVTIKAI